MGLQNLVIFGAGGLAKECHMLIQAINDSGSKIRQIAYVVDDNWRTEKQEIFGIPVKNEQWLIEHKDNVVCTCAIGYPKARREVQKRLTKEGIRFINLIHPNARIGEGSIIGVGCILQEYSGITVDCRLGDGVFLNGHAIVGHDSLLEDYVTCFPKSQISGKVWIGEAASIGSMAFVNEKIKIGAEAVVAPGSIVFNNVKERTYVMGNPAKRIEI